MSNSKLIEKQKKILNHFHKGDFDYVIDQCEILLKKNPQNFSLINLVGLCYQQKQKYEIAKKYYLTANKMAPNDLPVLNNLGNIYKNLNEFNNAKLIYEKALSINPNYLQVLVNFGNLQKEINNFEEAIKYFEKALSIKNDIYLVHHNLAVVYQTIGNFAKAKIQAKKVIELKQNFSAPHKMLSQIIDYNEDASHIKVMEDLIKKKDLNNEQKIPLYFALGKAYEDLKNYKKSIEYVVQGNKLKKNITKFDIDNEKNKFKDIQNFFEKNEINKVAPNLIQNKQIIFILGMPRSGTTLIEQIIASHPEVYGGGELPYSTTLINKFFYNNDLIDPKKFDKYFLNNPNFVYEEYFNYLKSFNITDNIITDKSPLNFRWIGFIKKLFPNSKIIHCNRNPKDICLSLYKNAFDGDKLNWTYDEEDIRQYYTLYKNLMNFWTKIYGDSIYTVQYEKLVSDQENEIKNLINHCDLAWNEKCLNFHKNKKTPIKTASISQARKEIYSSSINSNILYDKYLDKLFKNL